MPVSRAFPSTPPTLDPLTYPGEIPGYSYVLIGRSELVPLEPRKGRRLGQSIVSLSESDQDPDCTSLNYLLLKRNAAPIDDRHPVLAVGSNAAPAQLARKFAVNDVSPVVPVIRAEAPGLQVMPSAHLNRHGYLPWAPAVGIASDNNQGLFVVFVDSEQLKRLDLTEQNYDRVPLLVANHPVRLKGSDELLDACDIYTSKHGLIADPKACGHAWSRIRNCCSIGSWRP